MRTSIVIAVLGLAPSLAVAQQFDVPLSNWTVPPYRSSGMGGIETMTDATPPRAFVGIQPCRVADTRGNGAPIQGGIFGNGEARTWDLTGICGLPAGADAISANFTVTGSPSAPPGAFLLAWPTGGPVPPVSILNFQAGQTLANAAIVPLGGGEQINVNVSHSTHVIMDVNGYFSDTLGNPVNAFRVTSAAPLAAILGENTVDGYGVQGTSASGYGVVAFTAGTVPNAAMYALNVGSGFRSSGVFGSVAGTATNYGVWGTTSSVQSGAAGVFGTANGAVNSAVEAFGVSGVRGQSRFDTGVLGVAGRETNLPGVAGVRGVLVESDSGVNLAEGRLGHEFPEGQYYGVFSIGAAHVTGNLSVAGNFSSANKFFVQPHPRDPNKEIRYVSLEGPRADVYFRGTSQVSRGVSRITVPEDFRLVADPATYSTLVTPVGTMATVSVVSEGEEGIVVLASRDVRINYVVYAERSAIKNEEPIARNVHFVPSPDYDAFAYVPESYRRLLVENGILNADGTVNMETARRLGWDKEWEKRERPAPQPTSD